MPIYIYLNPKTGVTKEVIQRMTEPHIYSENGEQWQRIFHTAQISTDTNWDAMDSKNFVERSRTKKGKLGDLWEKSAELSEKREKIIGKDPIKEKFLKNWEKKRKKTHPENRKKILHETLDKKGVIYEP